jgi:hypothetical protein
MPAGPSPGTPVGSLQLPAAADTPNGADTPSDENRIGMNAEPDSGSSTTLIVTAVLAVGFLVLAVAYYLYTKYGKKVAPTPDLHRFTRMEQEMSDV